MRGPLPLQDDGTFTETFARQGRFAGIPRCSNSPAAFGADCFKQRWQETLPNGRTYQVLSIANNAAGDTTPIYQVPPGHYFLMGDNRDNSQDSRYPQNIGGVGFVPYANLLGRAERVVFSSAGKSLLYFWKWRKGRFFQSVYTNT